MKILNTVLVTLIFVLASGYTEAHTADQSLDQVILLDVQGFEGGTDLWISADGKAVCRFAVPPAKGESGLQETRYEFVVSAQQRSSLLELITKHSFFTIKTKDRYYIIPDEARPVIFVQSCTSTHAVGKWEGHKHNDFDPIYQRLLEIAESGENGKQTFRGPFEWNWKPDGFPENKSIYDMTKPKIIQK